jgi:hypothetical protein
LKVSGKRIYAEDTESTEDAEKREEEDGDDFAGE